MFQVLEPTYELRVKIRDSYPSNTNLGGQALLGRVVERKFYNEGTVGCDQALAAVKKALADAGIQADVHLEKFSHT